MSLPKNKSRLINIENISYRYLVKTNSDPFKGERVIEVFFHINDKSHGQLATFKTNYIVTPGLMKDAILMAIAEGWKPREKLPLFCLSFDEKHKVQK